MRTALALLLLSILPTIAQTPPAEEIRILVSQITPQGIIGTLYRQAPVGGGAGNGGYVGTEWKLGTEQAIVTGYTRQGDVAEGEKVTLRAVRGKPVQVDDGFGGVSTLRSYAAAP